MTERVIQIYATNVVTITHADGTPTRNGDVIGNALNGDAFSWERPNDLKLTFGTATTEIHFDDSNGILSDDPVSGATVTDQRLTQSLTIGGKTYTPNTTALRWQTPAPVYIENEYEVTLYDSAGTAYRMVGVSVTEGYVTKVVGVMFDGAAPPAGTVLYYLQGTSAYGNAQTNIIPEDVVCFLSGTQIATPDGNVAIENLKIGDLVLTLDGDPKPIRWIGCSSVNGRGPLAPVCITAGTFGNARDLCVSPNHRIFLRSALADLHFNTSEVLVAAKFLVNGTTIRPRPVDRADYYHLMLDKHELVFAEGIASESLLAGPVALAALGPAARAELFSIFPQLLRRGQRLSRYSLTHRESRMLLKRARPTAQTLPRAEAGLQKRRRQE